MKRVVFATALAGIASIAVYGTSLAAPIAPLPVAVTADNRPVVQAHSLPDSHHTYYWHHRNYHHRSWNGHHWHYY
jgi:hypothetical protein